MTLNELIEHYDDKSLPRPAYSTLCALRRLANTERCRYVVTCKGVTVAAFCKKTHAEDFAENGRANTPETSPIEVIDLNSPSSPKRAGRRA